jgi:mRNA interferase MazF
VIVSSAQYGQRRLDVILMAVTSQVKPTVSFGEVLIADWKKAGLLKPGVVKPIIATAETKLVIKRLGRLQLADEKALHETLGAILG